MKKKLLIIFVLIGTCTWAQDMEVPETAMPTPENKVLIDSLMKVSKFEVFFTDYCKQQIIKAAAEKRWSKEEISERKNRIKPQEFIDYTVYNAYASFSSQQLKKAIEQARTINTVHHSAYVLVDWMIIENLTFFVQENYLK